MASKYSANLKALVVFSLSSLLIFLGFYLLYRSGMSMNYLVHAQSDFLGSFVAIGSSSDALGEALLLYEPIIVAIFALLVFSAALALLSVSSPDKYRFTLALPILLSGVLFNFSKLFLFFGLGFYIACLLVIPLGETYLKELRRWKHFRVGSNAVGKGLMLLFVVTFIGSYFVLLTENAYSEQFEREFSKGLSALVEGEVNGFGGTENSPSLEDEWVERAMADFRESYPNLTEEQYADAELEIRQNIERELENLTNGSESDTSGVVDDMVETSPMIQSLIVFFPLLMSVTIWAGLEILRMFILSPISGLFSMFWFFLFGRIFGKTSGGSGKDSGGRRVEKMLDKISAVQVE